jgi:hypothetical protein
MKVISIFSYSLLVLEINIFHLHLHSKPSPLMQLRTVQPSPQTAPQTLFPHLHWQTSSFYHRGLCKRGSPARSQTQPADPPVLRSATINRSLSKCLVVSAITPCRLSPSLRTFLSSPLVLKIMISKAPTFSVYKRLYTVITVSVSVSVFRTAGFKRFVNLFYTV